MFLKVQTLAGVEAGYINLDNVDRIVITGAPGELPNTVEILGISGGKDFKISLSASQELIRHLNRYGIF